jgi:hypothetical protein
MPVSLFRHNYPVTRRRPTVVAALNARSADVPFLVFVTALGIVVVAVDNGLGQARSR